MLYKVNCPAGVLPTRHRLSTLPVPCYIVQGLPLRSDHPSCPRLHHSSSSHWPLTSHLVKRQNKDKRYNNPITSQIRLKTGLNFLSLTSKFGHPHIMGLNATVFSRGAHHLCPADITPGIQDFENPPQWQHTKQNKNSQITPLPKQRRVTKQCKEELPDRVQKLIGMCSFQDPIIHTYYKEYCWLLSLTTFKTTVFQDPDEKQIQCWHITETFLKSQF